MVEIASGLAEGETVVASSQFLIDSDANLRAAISQLPGVAEGVEPAHVHESSPGAADSAMAGDSAAAAHRHRRGRGHGFAHPHAHRRHPRPLRRPGHHPDGVSGPGTPHRRGPSHLPPHDADAVGALRAGGARLLVLRRLVRPRHLRGRDRPLLGPQPGPRIPELDRRPAAARRDARTRPRRDRRGLGLHVRAPLRPARPRRAALDPGLVPEVRADGGAWGVRGGERGGIRAAVPGHRRSEPAARLRTCRSRRSAPPSGRATATWEAD